MKAKAGVLVVAGCVGLLLVIWLGGTVAGLVNSGTLARIAPDQVLVLTLNSLLHITDPGNAWPAPWRRIMPGQAAMYLAWVGAGFAAISVGLFGQWLVERLDHGNRLAKRTARSDLESARWARAHDLKELRVEGPMSGRITLGRFAGRLIAAKERQSVIIAAPSQSGKTTGLVVPAILEWQGPVIATSVKGDLLDDTLAYRARMGRVMVFDPTEATKYPITKASPLSGCTTWQSTREVAHWLCVSSRPSGGGEFAAADFWYRQAEKLLAPILFAVARSGGSMEDVVRLLDEGSEAGNEVETGLMGEAKALTSWSAIQNRDPRQLSSISATAEIVVQCYADPRVAANSDIAEYTAMELLDGRANTLYLVSPMHEQERLAPVFSMMIQEVLGIIYRRASAKRAGSFGDGPPDTALSPPLLLALDELANIAPIPDLDKVASTGAAQGIQLLSVVQDFSQLKEKFGSNKAQSIVNNHRAKVFGSGLSDPETLDYVQRVTGAAEYTQRSETVGERHGSKTEGSTFRELAPANVVREQRSDEAVLIYGERPPARIRLRPWFKDKTLAAQVREGKTTNDG